MELNTGLSVLMRFADRKKISNVVGLLLACACISLGDVHHSVSGGQNYLARLAF